MDLQGPIDVKSMKALLDILHQDLKDRQIALDRLMTTNFQELTGVKSAVSEQTTILTGLSEQLLELRNGSDAVNELRREKQLEEDNGTASLREELERLGQEKDKLKQQYEELRTDHDKTLRDLETAKEREHSYRIQIGRMQKLITKNATNENEVIDSVVIQKTGELRARIQSIVGKYCLGRPTRLKSRTEFREWDDEWERRETSLPSHLKKDDVEAFCQYWTRAKIFFILHREIFGTSVFGLDEDLEWALSRFEGAISKRRQDHDSQIAEWRSLTIRCAKTLETFNGSQPRRTATNIIKFLEPWFSSKGAARIPKALEQEVFELCQSAYSLTLMLRQSIDDYFFVTIDEGTKVEAQDEADFAPQDMIGPKNKLVGSKVWLTVFGALVKRSQTAAPGERYVMERAHVICRAPTPLRGREVENK